MGGLLPSKRTMMLCPEREHEVTGRFDEMFSRISSSPSAVSTPNMMPLHVLFAACLARTAMPHMSLMLSSGSSGEPVGVSAATTLRRKLTRTRTTPSTVARNEEMASCVDERKFVLLFLGR